jgi:hypothetical protein
MFQGLWPRIASIPLGTDCAQFSGPSKTCALAAPPQPINENFFLLDDSEPRDTRSSRICSRSTSGRLSNFVHKLANNITRKQADCPFPSAKVLKVDFCELISTALRSGRQTAPSAPPQLTRCRMRDSTAPVAENYRSVRTVSEVVAGGILVP